MVGEGSHQKDSPCPPKRRNHRQSCEDWHQPGSSLLLVRRPPNYFWPLRSSRRIPRKSCGGGVVFGWDSVPVGRSVRKWGVRSLRKLPPQTVGERPQQRAVPPRKAPLAPGRKGAALAEGRQVLLCVGLQLTCPGGLKHKSHMHRQNRSLVFRTYKSIRIIKTPA